MNFAIMLKTELWASAKKLQLLFFSKIIKSLLFRLRLLKLLLMTCIYEFF